MNPIISNPGAYELTPAFRRQHADVLHGGQPTIGLFSLLELRAFPVADCFDDKAVLLACHTDAADTGGGLFVWRSTDDRDDNDGTVILPAGYTGAGRWVRLDSLYSKSYVDVTWFGAKSNVPGFDNAPAFNAAIQSLPLYASEDQVINNGFMRRGQCFVPSGNWYVNDTVVASGGMWIRGEGSTATSIIVNGNAAKFATVQTRTVTGMTRDAAQTTLGDHPVLVWGGSIGVTHLTFDAPHGIPIGHQASGLLEGLAGAGPVQSLNGFWHRFYAISTTEVEFADSGVVASGYTGATVEFERFILDMQIAGHAIAYNDVFGTRLSDIAVDGNSSYAVQNLNASGIWIVGAQDSSCTNVRVWGVGIRGIQLEVPADRVGVANVIRGPGIYTTQGYMVTHGLLHSEHINQVGTYLISDTVDPPVPRPAFMLTNLHGFRVQQIQGEDSPLEIFVRNATNIYIGDLSFNAGGEYQTTDPIAAYGNYPSGYPSGYDTTLLHISAGSHGFVVEGMLLLQGYYSVEAMDLTWHAKAIGKEGSDNNFRTVAVRTGKTNLSQVHTIPPGPFANDAAALVENVPVGAPYRRSDGLVIWKQAVDSPQVPPVLPGATTWTLEDPNSPLSITITDISDPTSSDPLVMPAAGEAGGYTYWGIGPWALNWAAGAWILENPGLYFSESTSDEQNPSGLAFSSPSAGVGTPVISATVGASLVGAYPGQLCHTSVGWWIWDGVETWERLSLV